MTADEVFIRVQQHLAEELGIEIGRITAESRFKEDLAADSLHLVELVMELEDSYGVRIPDDAASSIVTVGQAVDYVVGHQVQA